jgi:hypothetical protein
MHCDELLPLVEKLADGECMESERARAEAHLAECESCREHFGFVQALSEAGRKVPLPEPPGAYWDVLPRKVMARIEKEQSTQSSGGWFLQIFAAPRLRWLGAIAAGVIAVVLSYEVLNLEPERRPVVVRAPAEEPVLEDAVPSEPAKASLDAVTGEAEERIDPDGLDVGGAPRRKRPSSTSPEVAAPTPTSARKATPTGPANALQESKKVKERSDVPASPEPAPTAPVGAARVRARVESEDAPVAVMAEEMRKPARAPAPPTARPAVPRLEASEPLPRESSEQEGGVDEAGKREKYAVAEQAARGRGGHSQ